MKHIFNGILGLIMTGTVGMATASPFIAKGIECYDSYTKLEARLAETLDDMDEFISTLDNFDTTPFDELKEMLEKINDGNNI